MSKQTTLPGGFNAFDFDPAGGSSQLPVGRLPVVITDGEITSTKNNTQNGMIVYDLTVIDGPNKGATGQWRFNVFHQSKEAAEIAHRQLSALSFCVGRPQFNNILELKDIPFVVDVGPQKDNPNYTEVKKVYAADGREAHEIKAQLLNGGGQQQPQNNNAGTGGFGGQNAQGGQTGFGGQQAQTQQPQPEQQQPQPQNNTGFGGQNAGTGGFGGQGSGNTGFGGGSGGFGGGNAGTGGFGGGAPNWRG